MVQFDVGGIPSGSTVNSAELHLYVNNTGSLNLEQLAYVHQLTNTWDESLVTWFKRTTNDWAFPGGNYGVAVTSAPFASLSNNAWAVFPLPAGIVQDWLDNPQAHYCQLSLLSSIRSTIPNSIGTIRWKKQRTCCPVYGSGLLNIRMSSEMTPLSSTQIPHR